MLLLPATMLGTLSIIIPSEASSGSPNFRYPSTQIGFLSLSCHCRKALR